MAPPVETGTSGSPGRLHQNTALHCTSTYLWQSVSQNCTSQTPKNIHHALLCTLSEWTSQDRTTGNRHFVFSGRHRGWDVHHRTITVDREPMWMRAIYLFTEGLYSYSPVNCIRSPQDFSQVQIIWLYAPLGITDMCMGATLEKWKNLKQAGVLLGPYRPRWGAGAKPCCGV